MNPLTLNIFLSSRNNDRFTIDGTQYDTLTDIRIFLRDELEKETLFNDKFLTITINETFAADATEDSYNECIVQVKKADFVIALYNGNAGWAPPGYTTGICHAELEAALQVSNQKTAIIDLSSYFSLAANNQDEETRNKVFSEYISRLNRFTNHLKLKKNQKNSEGIKQAFLTSVRDLISKHLAKRVEYCNQYFNLSSSGEVALNWKKLRYDDRAELIKKELQNLITATSVDLKECLCIPHAIPDKISVSDARSFIGRPFLTDQDSILKSKLSLGPIHFIGVYGSGTESQVKNIIGYPDISVITQDFGFYVWEQSMHIQLALLTECNTPSAIQTQYLSFNNWATSSGEMENIIKRARARYHILNAMNEARTITSTK